MMYTFIAEQCADLPVEHCCRALKVSRSSFHRWQHLRTNPTSKMLDDVDLAELVVKIHDQSHGTYGAPRVTAELRLGLGRRVNHKRVERLMRDRGIQGVTRRPTRGCTRRNPTDPLADDLVHRQFRPDRPDRLWVQDITQHRTDQGWVYLAVVIDAWSRRVVGWSIADHLRAELVVDALEMARLRRQPDSTVVHSDHGSQGGFKWLSQHLDDGGVRWERCGSGSARCSSIEGRCRRRAGRRWRGDRIGSSSGRRSLPARRPRMLRARRRCHPQLRSGGSVTLVV